MQSIQITDLFRSILDAERRHRSDMLELRNRQQASQGELEYETIEQVAVALEKAHRLLLCEMAGIPHFEYVYNTFECARRRGDEEAMSPFRYVRFPVRNEFDAPFDLLRAAIAGDMLSPYYEMLRGELRGEIG